jgi:hypothetical protein
MYRLGERRWRVVTHWCSEAAGMIVVVVLAASFVASVITIVNQLVIEPRP